MNRQSWRSNDYLLHFGGSLQASSFHSIAVHKTPNNLIHQTAFAHFFSGIIILDFRSSAILIDAMRQFSSTRETTGKWSVSRWSLQGKRNSKYFLPRDRLGSTTRSQFSSWYSMGVIHRNNYRAGALSPRKEQTATPVPPTETSTFILRFLFFAFSKSLSNRAIRKGMPRVWYQDFHRIHQMTAGQEEASSIARTIFSGRLENSAVQSSATFTTGTSCPFAFTINCFNSARRKPLVALWIIISAVSAPAFSCHSNWFTHSFTHGQDCYRKGKIGISACGVSHELRCLAAAAHRTMNQYCYFCCRFIFGTQGRSFVQTRKGRPFVFFHCFV